MRWLKFNWHSFWLNYHIQLMADALDKHDKSRQHMRLMHHQSKIVKLLCDRS